MEIFKVIGIGIITTVAVVVLKPYKPEISVQLVILAGILIFMIMLTKLSSVVELINSFASKAGIEPVFLGAVIKIIGIAYITEFAGGICRDSGETALASKIEFAGKLIIIALAIPIMVALLNLLMKLMP